MASRRLPCGVNVEFISGELNHTLLFTGLRGVLRSDLGYSEARIGFNLLVSGSVSVPRLRLVVRNGALDYVKIDMGFNVRVLINNIEGGDGFGWVSELVPSSFSTFMAATVVLKANGEVLVDESTNGLMVYKSAELEVDRSQYKCIVEAMFKEFGLVEVFKNEKWWEISWR